MTATTGRRTPPRGTTQQRSQAEERPRLVVHHKRRVSARMLSAVFISSFFVILFMSVSLQSLRAEADHDIDALDQQIRYSAERYLELRAELAEKETPALIMQEAHQLGMIDPGPVAPLAVPDMTSPQLEEIDAVPGA